MTTEKYPSVCLIDYDKIFSSPKNRPCMHMYTLEFYKSRRTFFELQQEQFYKYLNVNIHIALFWMTPYLKVIGQYMKRINHSINVCLQVYGWGTTSSGGQSSSTLLEVSLPVVTNAQCATSMGLIEDGQICAGGEAGKDSCQVKENFFQFITNVHQ